MKSKVGIASRIFLSLSIIGISFYVNRMRTTSGAWMIAGFILSGWITIKMTVGAWRGFVKYQTLIRNDVGPRSFLKVINLFMPPWLFPYFITETKIFSGFWRTISRKPNLLTFPYTVVNGEKYSLFVPLLMIIAILDVPTIALITLSVVKNIQARHWIDGILAFGTIYGIVWILGDRRNIIESGHTVSPGEVSFNLGIRCSGYIAIETICKCQEISGNFKTFSAENKLPDNQIWKISPLDSPNVLIELKEAKAIDIVRFGYRRSINIKYIVLYIDQPRQFVQDINATKSFNQAMV